MKSQMWRLLEMVSGSAPWMVLVFITNKHSLPTPPPDLPLIPCVPEHSRLIPCVGRSKPYLWMPVTFFFLFWNKEMLNRKTLSPWCMQWHPNTFHTLSTVSHAVPQRGHTCQPEHHPPPTSTSPFTQQPSHLTLLPGRSSFFTQMSDLQEQTWG